MNSTKEKEEFIGKIPVLLKVVQKMKEEEKLATTFYEAINTQIPKPKTLQKEKITGQYPTLYSNSNSEFLPKQTNIHSFGKIHTLLGLLQHYFQYPRYGNNPHVH